MAEGKGKKGSATKPQSKKKKAEPAQLEQAVPVQEPQIRTWSEIHPIDASFLAHHEELAARSGADLCDCWVTIGIEGKWYPSVGKTWCRNQGQVGSGAVGHIYAVGTAKKFPNDPDGQPEEG